MTTTEFVQHIIDEKREHGNWEGICETSAYETAQLLSGSFTYLLYGALWTEFYDLSAISKHLEALFLERNHHGVLYFIALLANMVSFDIPAIYSQMSANDKLTPLLSAAIIEDWLEYHATCEIIAV